MNVLYSFILPKYVEPNRNVLSLVLKISNEELFSKVEHCFVIKQANTFYACSLVVILVL